MPNNGATRVLVVDDSAYVRKVVTQMLSRSPSLEVVGIARDGREALDQVDELQPDVITCDLIMPNLDGVGFVTEQMARKPVPIVIVSVASEAGELALNALDAGAVDFVQKPTALASERLLEMSDELIGKVKAAAAARLRTAPSSTDAGACDTGDSDCIARNVRCRRAGYFDRRTAGSARVSAAAACRAAGSHGDRAAHACRIHRAVRAKARRALLAESLRSGGRHGDAAGLSCFWRRQGAIFRCGGTSGASSSRISIFVLSTLRTVHPSNVLFQSAADAYSGRVLGIVMTGMGDDGREGAAWIKATRRHDRHRIGRDVRRLRNAARDRRGRPERSAPWASTAWPKPFWSMYDA